MYFIEDHGAVCLMPQVSAPSPLSFMKTAARNNSTGIKAGPDPICKNVEQLVRTASHQQRVLTTAQPSCTHVALHTMHCILDYSTSPVSRGLLTRRETSWTSTSTAAELEFHGSGSDTSSCDMMCESRRKRIGQPKPGPAPMFDPSLAPCPQEQPQVL